MLNASEVLQHVDARHRTHAFHIARPVNESELYRFVLPEAYRPAVLEREDVLRSRFGYAIIRVSKRPGSVELEVEKEVHVNAVTIDPADYVNLSIFPRASDRRSCGMSLLKKEDRLLPSRSSAGLQGISGGPWKR